MSAASDRALWSKLVAAGVVHGDMPERRESHAPWYVRVMLGVAGVLAAGFLLAFVGLAFQFVIDSPVAAGAVGLMLVVGAYVLFRGSGRSDFAPMFALAVSIAGQVLFVYGLHDLFGSAARAPMWAFVALFEIALAILMPSFIHRVGSSYAAGLALTVALSRAGCGFLAPGLTAAAAAWLWLAEARLAKAHSRVTPIAYGLTLAFVQIEATMLLGRGVLLDAYARTDVLLPGALLYFGESLVSITLVATVFVLMRRAGWRVRDRATLIAIGAAAAIGVASLEAPGIGGGLAIVVLGFAAGNAVLAGIGVAGLLFYVSAYYYLVELTLFDKALTLALTGTVLLVTRAVVLKRVLRLSDA